MIYGDWVTFAVAQTITGLSYSKLYRAVRKLGLETSKAGNTTLVKITSLERLKPSK
jgi:hypothetical protein